MNSAILISFFFFRINFKPHELHKLCLPLGPFLHRGVEVTPHTVQERGAEGVNGCVLGAIKDPVPEGWILLEKRGGSCLNGCCCEECELCEEADEEEGKEGLKEEVVFELGNMTGAFEKDCCEKFIGWENPGSENETNADGSLSFVRFGSDGDRC